MSIMAVIFDFDGVISDSELMHWQGFNQVLGEFGVNIPKDEYYDKYLGYTDTELVERVMAEANIDMDAAAIERLISDKAAVFTGLIKSADHIIDGVDALLAELGRSGIPMAIYSGASAADIDAMLAGSELKHFFSVIVSADDVSRGKPDPQGYLLALEGLNRGLGLDILPCQSVVIEDSHWGIEAARAAGMHVVAVTNSYGAEELAAAEKIVSTLRDLSVAVLRELCR